MAKRFTSRTIAARELLPAASVAAVSYAGKEQCPACLVTCSAPRVTCGNCRCAAPVSPSCKACPENWGLGWVAGLVLLGFIAGLVIGLICRRPAPEAIPAEDERELWQRRLREARDAAAAW